MTIISAIKFKNLLTDSIYVCTSQKDFYNACMLANRIVKKENQQFINAYIQSDNNCLTWFNFLENVDVITND